MIVLSQFQKSVVILVILGLSFSIGAKNKLSEINWLDSSQYYDSRIACEYKIQEEKWANSHWPVENDSPKPAFTEIADQENIKKIVLSNLKKETVLQEHFGITFTAHQIQTELNRIVQQTKAADRLKKLFKTFDNNATTIAECLVRPGLVNKTFEYQYKSNYKLHNDLKIKAEMEISAYQKHFENNALEADINNTVYQLKLKKHNSKHKKPNNPNNPNEIDLTQDQWDDLLNTLDKSNQLVEKPDYFMYQKVVSQNKKSITLETLSWKKEPAEKWLADITQYKTIRPKVFHDLKLKKVSGLTHDFSKSTSGSGFWEETGYSVQGRKWHTAIWTGSEMIIWGGNYNKVISIYPSTGYRYDPLTDTWAAMSKVNAPTPRYRHTAVWSGNEMIVWGGDKLGNYFDDGGKYNPITDSWTDMSSVSAPTSRSGHSAVLAGNEMIIWGGFGVSGDTNTGARYNLTNDTWQVISQNNAPIIRHNHVAVWAGNKMIVWGGGVYDSNTNNFLGTNTGGLYNPADNSWASTSLINAPYGDIAGAAIWTGTEMIVWGDEPGRYNPDNDTWSTINMTNAPSITWTTPPPVIWTGDEMIVWNSAQFGGGGRYNPVSNNWTDISINNEPSLRFNATGVWTGSEMIVWGGGRAIGYSNKGARYNPTINQWSSMSSSIDNIEPQNRTNHTAIWTGSEMLVWGGEAYGQYLDSGGRYDPLTHSWNSVSMINTPIARKDHTAVWTGRAMLVWGGQSNSGYLSTVSKYDPILNLWSEASDLYAPIGRINHTAVWTGREMLVWGGHYFSGQWNYLNSGGRYSPINDSWDGWDSLIGADVPEPRARHTAIWTGEKMVVWGGEFYDGNYTFYDTGAMYDPYNGEWTQTSKVGAPEVRSTHTAVWTGSEMLIWGGTGNGLYETGGKFDPINNTWNSMSDINAPSGRYDHTAIWTGREMVVWGGFDRSFFNTGGKYNPFTDTWTETSLLNVPEKRDKHTAVWTGREMIIWGGKPATDIGVYRPNNADLIFIDGFEG